MYPNHAYETHFFVLCSPLNLLEKGPYGGVQENFYHYRFVEVKHGRKEWSLINRNSMIYTHNSFAWTSGRIAMAAVLGILTQETSRFTGFLSPSENLAFVDVPNGLAALELLIPLQPLLHSQVAVDERHDPLATFRIL